MTEMPSVEQIRSSCADAIFGSPLVENSSRGLIAEVMVGLALGHEWTHTSQDWSGWDFEHNSGARLEVKQSALLQTWHSYSPPKRPTAPRFSIDASKGYFAGATWFSQAGRKADIYVFAFHGFTDPQIADQRDPAQWQFHVLPSSKLPATKSISLSAVRALAECLAWPQISPTVEQALTDLEILCCQMEAK